MGRRILREGNEVEREECKVWDQPAPESPSPWRKMRVERAPLEERAGRMMGARVIL